MSSASKISGRNPDASGLSLTHIIDRAVEGFNSALDKRPALKPHQPVTLIEIGAHGPLPRETYANGLKALLAANNHQGPVKTVFLEQESTIGQIESHRKDGKPLKDYFGFDELHPVDFDQKDKLFAKIGDIRNATLSDSLARSKKAAPDDGVFIIISQGHDRLLPVIHEAAQKFGMRSIDYAPGHGPQDKIQQHVSIDRLNRLYDLISLVTPKFAARKVAVPAWSSFDPSSRKSVDKAVKKVGYPLVIKPADGSASKNVEIVQDASELSKAIENVRGSQNYGGGEYSGFVMERMVRGTEYSVLAVKNQDGPSAQGMLERVAAEKDGKKYISSNLVTGIPAEESAKIAHLVDGVFKANKVARGGAAIDVIRDAEGRYMHLETNVRSSGREDVLKEVSNLDFHQSLLAGMLNLPQQAATPTGKSAGLKKVQPHELDHVRQYIADHPSIGLAFDEPPFVPEETKQAGAAEGRVTMLNPDVALIKNTMKELSV